MEPFSFILIVTSIAIFFSTGTAVAVYAITRDNEPQDYGIEEEETETSKTVSNTNDAAVIPEIETNTTTTNVKVEQDNRSELVKMLCALGDKTSQDSITLGDKIAHDVIILGDKIAHETYLSAEE